MMNEPLSLIMTTKLITLGPNDHLDQALNILREHRIHHLPIIDNGKLLGLITSYDLVKIDKPRSEFDQIPVKDVMTARLATMEPSDKIGAAAELLLEHLFHAVPIVDADKKLVGIVTTFDILKYTFRKEYPNQQS